MITLVLILQLLAFGAVVVLWVRLRIARLEISRLLPDALLRESPLEPLPGRLQACVEDSLLPTADTRGLGGLRVKASEAHDPYRNVRELLRHLAERARDDRPAEREDLVKGVYQLQHSLELPDEAVAEVFERLLTERKQRPFVNTPVDRVDRVDSGDRVDHQTMWPLNPGARVRYPLGWVVRDKDGKVLAKAKVVCE